MNTNYRKLGVGYFFIFWTRSRCRRAALSRSYFLSISDSEFDNGSTCIFKARLNEVIGYEQSIPEFESRSVESERGPFRESGKLSFKGNYFFIGENSAISDD